MTTYPFYSPYHFAGNTPIWAFDMDGLEPVFTTSEDGLVSITGYRVMAGQGPTQIAEDLNNNYSGYLTKKVDWYDITYGNQSKFQNVIHGDGQVFDKHNQDYKSGNIKTGDYLNISNPIPVSTPPDPPGPKGEPKTGLWDSPIIRGMTADFVNIGLGAEGSIGVGSGGSINLTWIVHGPDKSFLPYLTASVSLTAGLQANGFAGVDFGAGRFTGPTELITSRLLETNTKDGAIPTIGINADAAFGPGGGIGLNYTHDKESGYGIIGFKGQVGAGSGGGVSGSATNTFRIKKKEKKP